MPATDGWRHFDALPLSNILRSALETFAARGYSGTSIRDIAAGAGLSVAGMYHHYRSKQDILVALLVDVMEDLLERTKQAIEWAGTDAGDQMDALVECLVRFHMFRRAEAFVASTELRSLEPVNRQRVVAMRDEVQSLVEDALIAGRKAGILDTAFPHEAARAVSVLTVGIATWYRKDGGSTADEIVEQYLALIHGLVGADPKRRTHPALDSVS